MSSAASSPTILIRDSFHDLHKIVQNALSAAEQTCRIEVDRLLSDLHDARSQYELVKQEKKEAIVELERAKREIMFWKSTSEKAEVRILQQEETIEQTCKEARQWKEQLMRVDEEKAALRARLNELVAVNTSMSRQISTQEYLTPRAQCVPNSDTVLSSASRTTPTRTVPRKAHTHSTPRVNPITSSSSISKSTISPRKEPVDEPSAKLARSGVIIAASSSTSPVRMRAPEQYYETQPLPQTRVIKHVYVNMPLKDEDEDDVDLDDPVEALQTTLHAPLSTEKSSTNLRRATPGPSGARSRPWLTETYKRNPPVLHTDAQSTPTSEEEDELRIGAFDHDPYDTFGSSRPASPVIPSPRAKAKARPPNSPAKRKAIAISAGVHRTPRRARKQL